MPIPITFNFTIGEYNGTMGLSIRCNGHEVLRQNTFSDTAFSFDTYIEWPGTIDIEVFGKGRYDTKVDEQGRVIQDKYIKLDELIVDRIPLDSESLRSLIILDTGTEKMQEVYWGFNGVVNITIDGASSMQWHLAHRAKHYQVTNLPIESTGTKNASEYGIKNLPV